MKKKSCILGMIVLCFFFMISSCDIDTCAGERPIEYENSIWVSRNDEYFFCLNSEDKDQCYYVNPEGEKRKISFLWSAFDSHVMVFEYIDGKKVELLSGYCEFNEIWFSIENHYRNSPEDLPKELFFERVA